VVIVGGEKRGKSATLANARCNTNLCLVVLFVPHPTRIASHRCCRRCSIADLCVLCVVYCSTTATCPALCGNHACKSVLQAHTYTSHPANLIRHCHVVEANHVCVRVCVDAFAIVALQCVSSRTYGCRPSRSRPKVSSSSGPRLKRGASSVISDLRSRNGGGFQHSFGLCISASDEPADDTVFVTPSPALSSLALSGNCLSVDSGDFATNIVPTSTSELDRRATAGYLIAPNMTADMGERRSTVPIPMGRVTEGTAQVQYLRQKKVGQSYNNLIDADTYTKHAQLQCVWCTRR
jgi:hypothetical protein